MPRAGNTKNTKIGLFLCLDKQVERDEEYRSMVRGCSLDSRTYSSTVTALHFPGFFERSFLRSRIHFYQPTIVVPTALS